MNNYDVTSENSAASIATQNLRKLKIQEAIQAHAPAAESMVYKLSQEAEGEMTRLNASKDILDRAGFKPVDKSVNLNLEVETEANEELKELAKSLNDLNRTRKKGIRGNGVDSNIMD
jgi:predicted negative regulator of RcsB-dependent stress response